MTDATSRSANELTPQHPVVAALPGRTYDCVFDGLARAIDALCSCRLNNCIFECSAGPINALWRRACRRNDRSIALLFVGEDRVGGLRPGRRHLADAYESERQERHQNVSGHIPTHRAMDDPFAAVAEGTAYIERHIAATSSQLIRIGRFLRFDGRSIVRERTK